MARKTSRVKSRVVHHKSKSNNTMLFVFLLAVVGGLIVGYIIARERYTAKIAAISRLHMEKAVSIDSLNQQIQVLGAQTKAE